MTENEIKQKIIEYYNSITQTDNFSIHNYEVEIKDSQNNHYMAYITHTRKTITPKMRRDPRYNFTVKNSVAVWFDENGEITYITSLYKLDK